LTVLAIDTLAQCLLRDPPKNGLQLPPAAKGPHTKERAMGDWLIWLLLGSFIVILFCIYTLSSQVERCVHLAVEIITGNQRKILEQLEAISKMQVGSGGANVVPFERRVRQRRRGLEHGGMPDERRRLRGRRREDRVLAESSH
jgi:hypothetical protein